MLLLTVGVLLAVGSGEGGILPSRGHSRTPAKKSTIDFENRVIADDRLVTSFLHSPHPKTFFYLLQQEVSYLTFVVTPCSSEISWSLRYRSWNDTGKVEVSGWTGGEKLWEGRGGGTMRHTHERAKQGLYLVQARSLQDAAVQLYASSAHRAGYPGLDLPPARLHAVPSRTPGQLTVAWHPSGLDPQWLRYWVSVSRRQHVDSMCGASTDPTNYELHQAGSETHLVLKGLPSGALHYVDVFALHSATNISFLLARGEASYHKPKPTALRDSKLVSADLHILDGRANFRYKVREKGEKLEWYVEVCGGGSLEAEVRLRKRVLVGPVLVRGLARITLPTPPALDARYVLRLTASDPQQLAHITTVEVMGSMKGVPVITMPEDKSIHEYQGLKRCRSVTLGWKPALDPLQHMYCMRATLTPPETDPCCLHEAFNSLDFASLQCHDVPYPHNMTIITQELSNLKPGRTYYIQVTVKSSKAKISAYDVIKVYTKPTC